MILTTYKIDVHPDQAVLGQLVGDGQYGRFDALVVGGAGIP